MNTKQTIDDDMLSAYLDDELSTQEQQAVRAALVGDPKLAERLAALKRINDMVLRHAQALDATPLPAGVLDLLQADVAQPTARIVQGPWQRWTQGTGARMALAASLVLMLVVTSYVVGPASNELPALTAYADYLDRSPSGEAVPVDDATLITRFTFRDNANRYCRQYLLENTSTGSENVACRTATGWNLVDSIPATPGGSNYNPASGSIELYSLVDRLMNGPALSLDAEAALIQNGWQDQ